MEELFETNLAHRSRTSMLARLALAAGAALLSLLIARFVYLDVHVTSDEDAYIFQAYTFLEGRVARPLPPIPRIFDHEMIIQCNEIGWASRYAPGHSLWLVPGALLDNPSLMIAVAAALSLWLMMCCATLLGAPWWSAAAFLLISPYFLFMHGTVLSHTSAMTGTAAMLWGYLLWARDRRTAGVVFAGLAWAFLFINRSYTAALLAAPIGIDALLDAARNRRDGRVWRGVFIFALTAFAGPLLFMLYNWLVTGDAMVSTYLYYRPNQKMGFGPWTSHSPKEGLEHLRNNVRLLDLWLLGFRGGLPFFVILLAVGWKARWSLLAAASILVIVLGHIPFWYEGVNTCGPFYYFETLPYFVLLWILAAARLQSLARFGGRRLLAALCWTVLAANACAFMIIEGRAIAEAHEPYARLYALIASAPPRSVVAVAGAECGFVDGHLRNPRGVSEDVLSVGSIGEQDLIPARYFSDRRFFVLDARGLPRLYETNFDGSAFQYSLLFSTTFRQVGVDRASEADGVLCRFCSPDMGAGWMSFGQYPFLPRGRFRAVFNIAFSGVEQGRPVRIEIVTDAGSMTIAERILHGGGSETEHVLDFELSDFRLIEPRVWYGDSGMVEYRGMRIEELPPQNSD